jgi:YegS/Rv2252/BmrU family lipid kinase
LKPLVIVNPRSGGGKTGRTFENLLPSLVHALGEVDVAHTTHPGHAIELAQEERETIIAVGGDGTLHEVVNGVMRAGGEAKVGYIGQGTGGDFRRTLGIEHRLERYLDVLTRGETRRVDVGKATFEGGERWFINVLSAGLGGLVDRYVAEGSRAGGGKAAYAWASLKAIARSRPAKVLVKTEREEKRIRTWMLAICNGRYFGAGMRVAPMAALDDGRFEVVSMGGPSRIGLMMTSRKIYDGSHLEDDTVSHFTCTKIELSTPDPEPSYLDIDGEPLGQLPVTIELHTKALSIIAPA